MPGKPRQRSGPSSVLQDMFGQIFDFVGERVQEAAPHCVLCDEIAIPLRCPCGNFACKDHGYFNFALGRAICPECAAGLGAQVEPGDEEPEPPRRPRRRKRHDVHAIAWELLGLDPLTATAAEVNRAVRQEAKTCHPDLHPGDAQAERRFKALQRAKELCLADIANREEG